MDRSPEELIPYSKYVRRNVMDINFFPSLKHLSAVRFALTFYNADIIQLCGELVEIDPSFFYCRYSRICELQENWIKKRKEVARNRLSKFLPTSIENLIVNLFQPLVDEINLWFRDHFKIAKLTEKRHILNSLCWKPDGSIHRTRTAEQLVGNENIDRRVRFIVACIYFWENKVLDFWLGMSEYDRQSITAMDSNVAVRFWIRRLRGNPLSPWTQSVREHFRSDFIGLRNSGNHIRKQIGRLRLSSFFIALNTSDKKYFLSLLWPLHAHADDLRLCYSQMTDIEQDEIIHAESKTSEVLCCYLYWPFQSLFLDVADQVWKHLKPDCIEGILGYIFHTKLLPGKKDFDYLSLFKDIWIETSEGCKEELQKQGSFTLIRAVLTYDGTTNPVPFEEFLTQVNNFLLPPRLSIKRHGSQFSCKSNFFARKKRLLEF